MDRRGNVDFIRELTRSAWLPPFRGEIYDYAAGIDLQGGYAVKGRFDITTAKHIKEPWEAIRNPQVRRVSILGAVQTMKTLLSEIVVPYWIEHDPGDILFLYEDDPKAKTMAETRLMPMLRSIPGIARLMQDVDRHDKTKTKIYFPHCSLTVAGMNEGNVQSVSYRYVVIDELWMSRANGLARQAIYRTTQYRDTCKVILLGQGGFVDEDADKLHKETDMRELLWSCPSCGVYQPFSLARLREDSHPVAELRGTFSGLSWDTNERTLRDGRWNYNEAAKTAHIRCHHCDHRIEDRPEIRRQLMDSYRYEATNANAPIENVGFHWPALASVRIPFSDQVTKYLMAKTAKESLSYDLPMQEFYQKDLAIHWSADRATEYRAIAREEYNPNADWPNEAHRVLIADCQRDLQKFYYSVFAFAMDGESRMLARGKASSFDELAAIQKLHNVKDQKVFLDCGYRMTDVLKECLNRFHTGTRMVGGRPVPVRYCWNALKGSGQETFIHTRQTKKGTVSYAKIYSPQRLWNVNEGRGQRPLNATYWEWSNLHCKDLLRARRDGDDGAPKFLTLPDDLPDEDVESYFSQMRSEVRRESFKNGKKVNVWEQIKETRPNHYWDIGAMLMAVMAIVGVMDATPEEETAEQ